jgi:multiple antibiotic resistance protein
MVQYVRSFSPIFLRYAMVSNFWPKFWDRPIPSAGLVSRTMIDGLVITRISTDFLVGFSALFSLINPIGMAFVFADKTRALTDSGRANLAWRVAVYSLILILAAMFLGAPVLNFFGITLPALRIAGGLLVALAGYQMLTEPDPRAQEHIDSVMVKTADEMAFFPLTMPLTVGPGTIAVSIALGAQEKSGLIDYLVVLAIALPLAASIYVCYRYAARVSTAIGAEPSRIVTRLTAFLLMCIGVQMLLTGAAAWLGPLLRSGPVLNP